MDETPQVPVEKPATPKVPTMARQSKAKPMASKESRGALIATALIAAVLAVLIGWQGRGVIVALVNIGSNHVGYSGSFASTPGLPSNVFCSPANQTVAGGAGATLTGSGGGSAAYQWYAPGGTPFNGTGTSFTTQYNTQGTYTVVLVGDQRTAACNVTVNGSSSSSSAVSWTAASGVTVTGADLKKTAANAWGNAGAISTQKLSSGDGTVQVTSSETNTARMFGLSASNPDTNYKTIRYALYMQNNGGLAIYENGAKRGTFGIYKTGDSLQVGVESGKIVYRHNGTVVYTSTVVPSYPLFVDTALNTKGSTLTGATVVGGWSN